MAVKFQEPPADRRSKWPSIFDELRARPNEWALIIESAPNAGAAPNIRSGVYAGSSSGEFEARSVSAGQGKFDIYARYVGV
jgi:hypothetical protein